MSAPTVATAPRVPGAPGRGARRSPLAWLQDRGVRLQVLVAVSLAGLVAVLVGVVGITALAANDARTTALYEQNFVGLQDAAGVRRATLSMRLNVVNYAVSGSEADREKYLRTLDEDEEALRAGLASLTTPPVDERTLSLVADYEAALEQYLTIRDEQMLPAADAGDLDAFRTARDETAAPVIAAMMDDLQALVDGEKAQGQAASADAHALFLSSRTQMLVALVVGIVVALGAGLLVAGSIAGRLARVRDVAQAVARGDLTRSSGVTSGDEVGAVAVALDEASAALRGLVTTIEASASSLASASEEMSATSHQIAAAAEQTADQAGVVSASAEQVSRNVQTVAAGTEQMGASIHEIAENAARAAEVARRAVSDAAETTATMTRLGDSSREIGD
ncbi:MCP four helix bundle domain-containing protein, partial [Cellulomonas marina]